MSSMATWQVEPQYRTGRQVCLEFEFLSLAAGTTCDGLVGGWVNLVEYFPHGKGLVEEFCHKFLRGTIQSFCSGNDAPWCAVQSIISNWAVLQP
jgi:hypothetical protein